MMIDWFAERFSNLDFIDSYFVLSDLKDVPLTEAELCETALFDSFATNSAEQHLTSTKGIIPIGKLVI